MGASAEVSLAALRSFQELVSDQVKEEGAPQPPTHSAVPEQVIQRGDNSQQVAAQTIWKTAWKVRI